MAVNKLPFSDVPLRDSDSQHEGVPVNVMKERKVKRIVHFSDGVLEEYSTDDEVDAKAENKKMIDPKALAWVPYIWFHMSNLGTRTLSICDYFGERLAWMLGITSPKYQYELDEAKRMAEEEEKEKKIEDEEYAGWKVPSDTPESPSLVHVSEPKVTFDQEISRDYHVPSISSTTEAKSQSDTSYDIKPVSVHNSDILSAESLVDPQSLMSINKVETAPVSKVYDSDFNVTPPHIVDSTEFDIPEVKEEIVQNVNEASNVCETTPSPEVIPMVEVAKEAKNVEHHVSFDDNVELVSAPEEAESEENLVDLSDVALEDNKVDEEEEEEEENDVEEEQEEVGDDQAEDEVDPDEVEGAEVFENKYAQVEENEDEEEGENEYEEESAEADDETEEYEEDVEEEEEVDEEEDAEEDEEETPEPETVQVSKVSPKVAEASATVQVNLSKSSDQKDATT